MTQAIVQDATLVLPTATPAVANELAFDASGRLVYYNGTLSRVVVNPDSVEDQTFTQMGTLKTGVGTMRWYLDAACTVESIRIGCNTSPTGAAIICDVNKNGTTIYTTQSNRPTIAISGNTQVAATPDITTFAVGDYVTVDVDQVGSSAVGADLTVTIRLRRT